MDASRAKANHSRGQIFILNPATGAFKQSLEAKLSTDFYDYSSINAASISFREPHLQLDTTQAWMPYPNGIPTSYFQLQGD